MKKSIWMFSILALVLSGAVFISPAQAHGGHGGSYPMKHHGGSHEENKYGCPIAEKFFFKAHYFIDHQQQLGLSEPQINDIKALKHDMKKALIKNAAANQIFGLDLKQQLSEPKMDQAVVGALIDKQAAAVAAGAKDAAAAYANLISILTPDQTKKIKELWLAHEAKEHGE